jgi:transposase
MLEPVERREQGVMETSKAKKRRMRSKAERRRIVEETFEPGASVARVARAHEVNANQVFNWRRLYREGRLAESPTNALLPVQITPTEQKSPRRRTPRRVVDGTIDIDLGHARIRVLGAADPECVRAALAALVR